MGYGDRYPVTTDGRTIAVLLMVLGIGTLGAITASVAAWMVRQVQLDEAARKQGVEPSDPSGPDSTQVRRV